MTAGQRPGGAVALTGLVTFLMVFGLAASPIPFDVPVFDRTADIAVLSLYTVGATALLLPPPEPRWPAAKAGRSTDGSRSRPSSGAAPKDSAVMRKILSWIFQKGHRTHGPSEQEMNLRGLECADRAAFRSR